jgi:hypothetical protein
VAVMGWFDNEKKKSMVSRVVIWITYEIMAGALRKEAQTSKPTINLFTICGSKPTRPR